MDQIMDQLTQVLQERAGLQEEQARQAAQVAVDFVREHLPQVIQSVQGGNITLPGGLGDLFGQKQ